MNERIRELAEQAGIEFDDSFSLEPETIYYLKLSDFEKFAELIVQECVNVLHDNELWNRHISHVLKEHFGVEQ